MGWATNPKMRRLIQFFHELIARAWRHLKNSRFFLAIICLIIGATYTYVYQVGLPYYQTMREGYQYSTRFIEIRADQGNLVSTGLNQAEESEKVESEIAPATSSPTISKKIFQLESSSGKNDKCQREGLGFNGYGYGVYNGKFPCFKTQEEIDGIVKDWIEMHIAEGLTEGQIACHYNQGNILDTCDYYQKYLSLTTQ
jgi:hypothetical protein